MPRPRITPAEIERAVELYREHGNVETVAGIMRRSRKTISRVLKENGVTLRFVGERREPRYGLPPPVPPAELERIIREERRPVYEHVQRRQIERAACPLEGPWDARGALGRR